jgi:hypothetical protein
MRKRLDRVARCDPERPPRPLAAVGNLEKNRRLVHIEIEPDHDQVRGQVDAGDGSWRPFWGWLELMQAIEDAGEPRSATGER